MAAGAAGARIGEFWQRVRFAPTAALLLIAAPIAAQQGAGKQTADPVGAAIRQIQGDGSYQLQFPAPPPIEPPSDDLLSRFFRWLGGDGDWRVRGLAVVLILVAVAAIAYMLVPAVREFVDRLRFGRRRQRADAPDEASWQPDATGARNLLQAADALAADGRFAEAVHLLLERSVEDIGHRRPGLVRPAFTARSIAMLHELPEAARQAFGQICAIVERGIWAERAIDAGDWTAARAQYESFAFGAHWRVRA